MGGSLDRIKVYPATRAHGLDVLPVGESLGSLPEQEQHHSTKLRRLKIPISFRSTRSIDSQSSEQSSEQGDDAHIALSAQFASFDVRCAVQPNSATEK